MSNLSISITDEDKQKISLAKDVTQKNIQLLREYAITKPDAENVINYIDNLSSDVTFEDLLSQMQSLELWLDGVLTALQQLELSFD